MGSKIHYRALGEITDWFSGGTPSKKIEDYWNGDIPWISASSMGGVRYSDSDLKITEAGLRAGSRLASKGSILLLVRGSALHKNILVGIAERDVAFNQDVKAIRVKEALIAERYVDEAYIYYWLRANKQKLLEMVEHTGIGAGKLDTKRLQNIEVRLPSWKEQRKIVSAATSLDEKEALNSRVNQTLEQIAQAIFKSWFVDFEPVKAKISALAAGGSEEDALLAAMQAISGKEKAQLTQLQTENPEHYNQLRTTAELFPSAMQDSELGEIPEGWSSSDIGKEVTVVGGATPSTKNPEFWDGGDIAWTSPRDLSNLTDKVLVDTERKITEAGLAKISSGLLPINTVLMSSRAPVGYLALTKLPLAVNQGYIAMKCEKVLSPEFTLQWCSEHMDEIKNRASGTTFAEISKKNFKVIPVIVPKKEIIDAFSKQVRPLYSKIEINIRKSHSLGLIRDSLLPKLLSGSLQAHNNEVETD
ncbi:restriction endonuclease subunit S [Idiomarina zobellii]|uniref:Restriction endonuclease subunit S n=1 Tax=Idiomarina zobellii TaxID=86103 RepID=A0A837NEG5_9GAMM|nr:restriction endonuclease subunit S [Idiomarina zobellii]KPD20789.1 restriction endonuclease subunit S [Idiomarina zobellii]SDG33778.1 type I restriction enzyme, S subunit [Idiomarina zobellii]